MKKSKRAKHFVTEEEFREARIRVAEAELELALADVFLCDKCWEAFVASGLTYEEWSASPDGRCPVRGAKMKVGTAPHPDSLSIDAIDPRKSHVTENLAAVSRLANNIKNDCTDWRELGGVAKWQRTAERKVHRLFGVVV